MDSENQYKVLWVDDDDSIVESTKLMAQTFCLKLDRYPNWKEAKPVLDVKFNEYSAIILDVYCKIEASKAENALFISSILPEMKEIFKAKGREVPWYLFSARDMNGDVIDVAEYNRKEFEDKWGKLFYQKGTSDEKYLFKNIVNVAEHPEFVALSLHKDVFDLVGEGKLIDSSKARTYLLDMFGALYYPNKCPLNHNANDLRGVLGEFFKAAHRRGLLADEYVKGKVSFNPAYAFMAYGEKNNLDKVNKSGNHFTQYYKEEIFPEVIQEEMAALLKFSQTLSHAENIKNARLVITNEEHFGHLFLLCHIIKWFGKYVEDHNDREENKAKIKQR